MEPKAMMSSLVSSVPLWSASKDLNESRMASESCGGRTHHPRPPEVKLDSRVDQEHDGSDLFFGKESKISMEGGADDLLDLS